MRFTEQFWRDLFAAARADGGFIVSKSRPPSWANADYRESVWEHHEKTLRRLMPDFGYRVLWESTKVAHLSPL
jgi:hypothetical protein